MKASRWVLSLVSLQIISAYAAAETVYVKYRGAVDLELFSCKDVATSDFIHRVCYLENAKYLVIKLNQTYYHYCEIDATTVKNLLLSESMGKYFNANIRGSGQNGPFDCRTHQVPELP